MRQPAPRPRSSLRRTSIAAFTCTFISGAARNQTQVTLQHFTSSNTWIGTLISTDNQ